MTIPTRPRILLFTSLVLLCAAATFAEPAQLQLRVPLEDPSLLGELGRLVSVEDFDGEVAIVTVLPSQLPTLQAHGFVYEVLPPPKTTDVSMCEPGWEHTSEPAWDCYPDYDQYVALMQRLADEHPLICNLVDLGSTTNIVTPHRLLALQITEEPEVENPIPEVLLTSTMHGDETAGFVLLLRLAWELLESYGPDPEVTELVRGTEIWINPLANPDGTYFGGNHTVSRAIRFFTTTQGGATSVNPNRNYPDPEDGPHPDGWPWWRETEAMMAFAALHSFTLSANLHGGAEIVNYPWDTWCDRHPDDDWLLDISTSWATAAQQDGPPGYMDDCRTPRCTSDVCRPGVTHGADWYSISGGRQDYMTFFRGGRELTVEVSGQKLLPSEQLDEIWHANQRALLGFLQQTQRGIHGIVRDPAGAPLSARVELIDHDTAAARSWVLTDPEVGDFHRLTLPGTYDLSISATGFIAEIATGVVVPQAPPYPELEIELMPDPQLPSPTTSAVR